MKTTLNKIREHSPCESGWKKLLKHLGKTQADDDELSLLTILDSSELDDALRCLRAVDGYDKEKRLYAVWCARKVQHRDVSPWVIKLVQDAVEIERENCAKACAEGAGAYVHSDYTKGLVHGARLCAAHIRAMGEK